MVRNQKTNANKSVYAKNLTYQETQVRLMKLYGMLDSPFVRRVAISLATKQLPFEHNALSVFSTFNDFSKINPVVKAPTLVLDDGTYLIDSTLILNYLDQQHSGNLGFFKLSATEYQLLGLGLVLAEKAVQYVYESELRPTEKQVSQWKERVLLQAHQACQQLNQHPLLQQLESPTLNQANITVAIAWRFVQEKFPALFPIDKYPQLHTLMLKLEQTEVFQRYPFS